MWQNRSAYYARMIAMKNTQRGPGQAAVDRVADNLEATYHKVISAMQNASPFDESVKAKVKQLINEFADFKADAYEGT